MQYDLHLVFPDGTYVQSGLSRDGTPIGTLAIHAGMHIIYRDLNGNGMPDPGEITAEFE